MQNICLNYILYINNKVYIRYTNKFQYSIRFYVLFVLKTLKILFYEYGAPEKKKIFLVYSENIVHNDEQKKSEKFDLLTLILKCASKKLNTRKFFF